MNIRKSITDRSDTVLADYLHDISKIKILDSESEKEIATKVKNGDKKAKDILITSNLRFVVSVAKQYQGQGLPLIDLINEGNCGLIKAAEKYDPDKGFKFISYAVWWIRQSIIQGLSDKARTIRQPVNQVHSSTKIYKAIKEFEQKNERQPSELELEEMINIPAEKINSILGSNHYVVSINTPFSDDGDDGTLVDVIPNNNIEATDATLEKESKDSKISALLNKLTIREHDIIRLYFGIGTKRLTLEEIGCKFGITNERARQIKEGAIRKLKVYKDQIKFLY
jgi:RNA polymerase primary sigma factor